MTQAQNTFDVMIDGERVTVPGPTISGAQLKAKAGKDAIYQLFRERGRDEPDLLIADHMAIAVETGMNFYTVPPAMMGC